MIEITMIPMIPSNLLINLNCYIQYTYIYVAVTVTYSDISVSEISYICTVYDFITKVTESSLFPFVHVYLTEYNYIDFESTLIQASAKLNLIAKVKLKQGLKAQV